MIIGGSPSTSRLRLLGCSAEDLAYGPKGLAARHCDLRPVTCLDGFKHRTGQDGGRGIRRCAPPTPSSLGTTRKRAFPPRWSGWRDLNPRPLRPERSALPSCATPRCPESAAQSNRDSIAERSPTHVNDGSGQRATRVSGRRGSATSPLAGRRSAGANRARYRGRRSRGTTSDRPICAASAHDAHQCRS